MNDICRSAVLTQVILALTTIICVGISIFVLIGGYQPAFQNIIYIPVLFASFIYAWRGFYVSCIICLIYILTIWSVAQTITGIEPALVQGFFCVGISAAVAGMADQCARSKEKLAGIETEYHALFDSMNEGFAYCRMIYDNQGKPVDFKYLKVNNAFEKLTRLVQVEGKRAHEVHHDLITGYPELFHLYSRVSNTGNHEKLEYIQKSTGTLLSVSAYCPQKGSFLAIFVDITGRRKSEEALKERKDRVSQIISRLPIPLCYVSSDNSIEYMNGRFIQIFGYSHLELPTLYTFWDRAFPDEMYRQWVRHTWQRAVKVAKETGCDIEPAEYTVTCRNGDLRIIEISGITIEDHIIATFVDVTDRLHAEEAVREANQKLRFLTGITRHDIFNQLNAMYLYLDMAMEEEDPDQIHVYVSKVQGASRRIQEITGFTREFEHFGTGSSRWQNINQIIESAKSEIQAGVVSITSTIPKEFEIYADPIIRKVFSTLFDNAIRHGGDDITSIRLSVHEAESSLRIICEDDGAGVSAAEKEKIFANGFGKNTGIGLFLSREILAINDLSIIETGTEGEGARFEIGLPAGKYRFVKEENR